MRKIELEAAFSRFVKAAEAAGFVPPAGHHWHLQFPSGSQAARVFWEDERFCLHSAGGMSDFLGNRLQIAVTALDQRAAVLWAVADLHRRNDV